MSSFSKPWEEFPDGRPPERPAPPKPTVEQTLLALPMKTVKWGQIKPPDGRPFATHEGTLERPTHSFVVYLLSDGRRVIRTGLPNPGYSTPDSH